MQVQLEHGYAGFSIILPRDHMMPTYYKAHPKYDRFLPHLVKFIERGSTVVDVGANCGDTLAGMVQYNPSVHFVCIEPQDVFFDYLTLNVGRIRERIPDVRVTTVKSLVGSSSKCYSLKRESGTAHAVVEAEGVSSKPLDQIIVELSCPPVRLLKIDVDGFDFDVLDSSQNLLATQRPLVFFECNFDNETQKTGYERSLASLRSIGYRDWTVFDNFGECMLRTNDIAHLYQLMEYLWRQKRNIATRTLYYYDVLAVTDRDTDLVGGVLKSY